MKPYTPYDDTLAADFQRSCLERLPKPERPGLTTLLNLLARLSVGLFLLLGGLGMGAIMAFHGVPSLLALPILAAINLSAWWGYIRILSHA